VNRPTGCVLFVVCCFCCVDILVSSLNASVFETGVVVVTNSLFQASQLALKLQMMDDMDVKSSSSAPTSGPNFDTSSREMLLEYSDCPSQPHIDQRVRETAADGTGQECHDIPIDTPRFLSLRDTKPLPTDGAPANGVSDMNTDSVTESDLSSFPSGSNSARYSNSGRCVPPNVHNPSIIELQFLYLFILCVSRI
jgi:hypothetical protein